MAQQGTTITPLEVLTLLHQFADTWRSGVTIDLSTEQTNKGALFFQVGVQTSVKLEGHDAPVVFRATDRWPNRQHKSLLAQWVWLAHNVDQQIDASMHLTGTK